MRVPKTYTGSGKASSGAEENDLLISANTIGRDSKGIEPDIVSKVYPVSNVIVLNLLWSFEEPVPYPAISGIRIRNREDLLTVRKAGIARGNIDVPKGKGTVRVLGNPDEPSDVAPSTQPKPSSGSVSGTTKEVSDL